MVKKLLKCDAVAGVVISCRMSYSLSNAMARAIGRVLQAVAVSPGSTSQGTVTRKSTQRMDA